MNPHLERGILLYQQSRHELAEAELRQALATEPQDAYAHALLALCLLEREKFNDATAEAQQAIHLAPDFPHAHSALARVFYRRNRYKEALAAIQEAIRLDSSDADSFGLLAAIQFDERRWPDTLAAAEQGLELDAEHIACTNLRAMALVKLGRKAEAGATIDAALAKAPENSVTHANQGWTYLEKGDPKRALEHFREALRLDPSNDWARQGIVEALKARNFIYAIMLKYFLFMSKLSRQAQWFIILGGYFGNQMLRQAARSNPELAPWLLPLRILYISFALMTWLADPLFNLLLRLNRFGRLALSREQTVSSNWIGISLLLALLSFAACLIFNPKAPWILLPVVFGLLVIPLSGVFRCASGWPRNLMAGITAVLALMGITAVMLAVLARTDGMDVIGRNLFYGFAFGSAVSLWIANALIGHRPRR